MLPADLERRMSGADLAEWEAYELVFGPIVIHERLDYAQALLARITAMSHGGKERDLKAYMPTWDQPPPREQSADELVEVLRTWARRKT